mmetsp:Transcript_19/g.39  ORF Transcript_19/g.39 Transcript_19/m.39 type:complete len:206 (+) Transcript_19:54-671(+)
MTTLIPFVSSFDSRSKKKANLAKVHTANLPMEIQLANFIQDLDKSNLPPIWHSKTPACDWPGIHCNPQKEVIAVMWYLRDLRGMLSFRHLPPTTNHVNLSTNSLSGSVDLSCLPGKMTHLNLSYNKFSGPIHLDVLPQTLTHLHLNDNDFSGRVEFDALPPRLQLLVLSKNKQLRGTIIRTHLPNTLQEVPIIETEIRMLDKPVY